WLHCRGLHYVSYKKTLYFDGHECPNVVHYQQNTFLPAVTDYFMHPLILSYLILFTIKVVHWWGRTNDLKSVGHMTHLLLRLDSSTRYHHRNHVR
ncbi:hypothetical protein WOLCODRAFT_67521, partial [Wolfiporia cocos MD-104 SS10]